MSFEPPINYTSPSWPSLDSVNGTYAELYYFFDVWAFTTIWTVVLNIAVYALTGVWVMLVFRRKRLSVCAIPLYMFLGALTGFFTAAPFAAVLAAVYQSGQVAMATNISLVWGALLTIVLLIAALSKSTFLL